MNVQAAIIEGPRGPFAVLRVPTAAAAARRQIGDCFRSKHGNMPVVFVNDSPGALRPFDEPDVTDELQACIDSLSTRPSHVPMPWSDFAYETA